MTDIQVTIVEGPVAPDAAVWHPPGAGAVVRFEGVVRPAEGTHALAALDYEVYDPMASRLLRELAQELAQAHHLLGVRVEHSRGRVDAGACAFRLCVAAAHRDAALTALAQFIDRMKQDVPIWKTAVAAAGPLRRLCETHPAALGGSSR